MKKSIYLAKETKVLCVLLLLIFATSSSNTFAQTGNEVQGTGSGSSLGNGDYNSFYGDSSGTTESTGSRNTLIGFRSGFNMTSGYDNIKIGFDAGYENIGGDENIFIGTRAGRGIKNSFGSETQYDNVFI
ncbi:MAG: hypothetical protein ACPGTP_07415, partial [Bacteroidia bacterium]